MSAHLCTALDRVVHQAESPRKSLQRNVPSSKPECQLPSTSKTFQQRRLCGCGNRSLVVSLCVRLVLQVLTQVFHCVDVAWQCPEHAMRTCFVSKWHCPCHEEKCLPPLGPTAVMIRKPCRKTTARWRNKKRNLSNSNSACHELRVRLKLASTLKSALASL